MLKIKKKSKSEKNVRNKTFFLINNFYVEAVASFFMSREETRTSKPSTDRANFVPPFEINLLLLWLQCREAQMWAFLEQAKPTLEHPHTTEKTVVRPLGSGRVRILWRSWKWCDSGLESTTKR